MKKVKCFLCKKEFEKTLQLYNQYKKRKFKFFCSSDCRIKVKNTGKTYSCLHCGKDVYRTKSQLKKTKNVYCSSSCAGKSNYKIRVSEDRLPNYKTGKFSYRQRALRYFKNKCYFCDYSTVKILQVHHIDKDRNNNIENLLIVCPTHHNELHEGIISIMGL